MELESSPLLFNAGNNPIEFSPRPMFRTYLFDRNGGFSFLDDFDIRNNESSTHGFKWLNIVLPRDNPDLSFSLNILISKLCPPLNLNDILSLVSDGPFCDRINGVLMFCLNLPGAASSEHALRLAAIVSSDSIITVSVGEIPNLGFSRREQNLLSQIPVVVNQVVVDGSGMFTEDDQLDYLLNMNHFEADIPVPRRMCELLRHIITRHVDHVQELARKLEKQVYSIEVEFNQGSADLKKEMIDDRRIPKIQLNLQRLLQVVAYGEQVLPHVREICATENWCSQDSITVMEGLIGRFIRIKENLSFTANRLTIIQDSLNNWHNEQIKRKLDYFSSTSVVFLALSIIIRVFGMNVGGIPWTGDNDIKLNHGFYNVLLLSVATVLLSLFLFTYPNIYR